MTVTPGAMTIGQLEKYLVGYAQQGLELIKTDLQTVCPIEAAVPSTQTNIPKISFFVTHGTPGQMDVVLDAPPVLSRWNYKEVSKDMLIQKYSYQVLDSARAAIAVDDMAVTGTQNAMAYFANIHAYKIIKELRAKNTNTHGASAYWNVSTGNPEGDIVTAIESIMSKTGINPATTTFGVVFPSKVMSGINQLDLLGNVQQNVKDYLSQAWNINWYPFTPYMDADGNTYLDIEEHTSSDSLSTTAVVFAEGLNTIKGKTYVPPNGVPMSETTRLHDSGFITTLRHSYECLAVPRYNASTTPLIYEITGVSA